VRSVHLLINILFRKFVQNFNGKLSIEFPMQYPLSTFLFKRFINNIFDKCKRYSMVTERKKCCSVLFVDDTAFFWPLKKSSLKNLLNTTHDWGIKNEITFDISKCNTFVKLKNFLPSRHYENPTFNIDMDHLQSTNHCIYLGIPFNKSLGLEPIIAKMNSKINYTVYSFFFFFFFFFFFDF